MNISFSGDICSCCADNSVIVSDEIVKCIQSADYRFFCCEAPFIELEKHTPFVKEGPTLYQKKMLDFVTKLFTHASIANNHIMDYGIDGLKNTIERLGKNRISAYGAGVSFEDAYRPAILEKDGVSVAVLCLAESQFGCCRYREDNRGGYAWLLNTEIESIIKTLKPQVDAVIVFAHAGLEHSIYPLPEWRSVYHHLIDCGCDLVVASHPHIIQGKEEYNGKWIYYSLGNFFFDSSDTTDEWRSSLHINVSITKEGIQSVKEIFMDFTSNSINIAENLEEKFVLKSDILKQGEYEKYLMSVNKEVLRHWTDYYESYFSYPIKSHRVEHSSRKRRFFYKLFKKQIEQYYRPSEGMVMLYHNMMVDTHRFAISRAISLLKNTY